MPHDESFGESLRKIRRLQWSLFCFLGVGFSSLATLPGLAQTQRTSAPAPEHSVRAPGGPVDLRRGLIADWPLSGDVRDRSGNGHHAEIRGDVDLAATGTNTQAGTAAGLNGHDAFLVVAPDRLPRFENEDFSISVWLFTDKELDDVPGDIISRYDPAARRGFHLSLKTNAGVTSSQPNSRHLQFGIDDDQSSEWIDCGRPGGALLAFSLAVHEQALYAGTCEPAAGQSGKVYRYAGGQEWIDCGAPDQSNAVTALAVHRGELYAGTGKYRLAGSALPESQNPQPGGRIFRYAGGSQWTDCGQLPDAEAVGGLVEYRGQLYASSLYRPAGFFRYDGGTRWDDCGTPGGKRVEALCVYNGFLYASSYDGGRVYRYDGRSWTDCGQLGENTQTYSFAVYQGRLHVGTWPSGRVYRFEDIDRWTDVGRLGEELEVMGMLVHNGRMLAGTLPLAEVYEYRGNAEWARLARLDHTPDVKYRRAWTMAEHGGRLFCSTLPSGKIYSFAAGRSVSWDRTFPTGWHHVAAVRSDGRLILYVDGEQVAESRPFDSGRMNPSCDAPLRIGSGSNDHFRGKLCDLRLFSRALNSVEIQELAGKRECSPAEHQSR